MFGADTARQGDPVERPTSARSRATPHKCSEARVASAARPAWRARMKSCLSMKAGRSKTDRRSPIVGFEESQTVEEVHRQSERRSAPFAQWQLA